jgi:hypothetical protein
MIIDYTFFQDGLLMVDGALALATPSPTNEAIARRIDSFIETYEPEYLCKLLGEELYNDFLVNGETDKWEEFKKHLVTKYNVTKASPIANYVYFHFVRDSQSIATINGVKKDGEENLVNPQSKMISAWNDMVHKNRIIYSWLCRNFRNVQTEQELLETINVLGV